MPRVRNWLFIGVPECMRLQGEVYDHLDDHFPDGEIIKTSCIDEVDMQNKRVVTRSGTTYHLDGPPDSAWEKWARANGFGKDYLHLFYPN